MFKNLFPYDLFIVKPEYFPMKTKEELTQENIIRFGALPLGTKIEGHLFKSETVLNIGFVNPRDKANRKQIESLVSTKYPKIRPYQIRMEDYLLALNEVYAVSVDNLQQTDATQIYPEVREYLK